jgi:hypothetical protein
VRGPGQRSKCPTCAEKDAEIARLIAALEFERDPCRRAVSKDGRCEHEARATAAEQERDELRRGIDCGLNIEGYDDAYRVSEVANIARRWLRDSAKLAAAEQREAELRAMLVARSPFVCPTCGPYAKVDEDQCCAACGADCVLASPSTPSPAPSAEPHEAKLAELLALPENWGVDGAEARITEAAAETVRGLVMPWSIVPLPRGGLQIEMHRCGIELEIEVDPDGRVTGVLAGEDGNIENMAELEIPAPSPLPRSAPREAGAQPEAGEPKDTRRDCTCLGTCKGPEGLGPRWRCVMGREKPLPVAASEPKEQP